MKQSEVKQTSVTINHYYCDCCNTEISWPLACCVTRCEMCGKDLCEKCIGHENYEMGDYRTVYCQKCWSNGEEYRQQIAIHESEIERLENEWITKCKTK